jgi:hypothetical protein
VAEVRNGNMPSLIAQIDCCLLSGNVPTVTENELFISELLKFMEFYTLDILNKSVESFSTLLSFQAGIERSILDYKRL